MCMPPYSLLPNGWQNRFLFSLHSSLLQKPLHSGGLQMPSPPLRLKSHFRPPWGRSVRLGHLLWPPPPQWLWHTHPSPSLLWQSLLSWNLFYPTSLALSCSWEVLQDLGSDHLPVNLSIPLSPVFRPKERPPSFNFQKACWDGLPPTLTLTVSLQRNTRLFLFHLLLLSLLLWYWMRPNLPLLSAPSNALLKSGGLLRWKVRLVKDARLSLQLTEVMKIARLTSPLLDAPRQSSPRPRRRHGRRLALLSHLNLTLNLYTLFFALSLTNLPRLLHLLTFPTVLLPGNRLPSMPLTGLCHPGRSTLDQILYLSQSISDGFDKPRRALGRSSLLSISLKLLTLTGIPPFSTNSFQLASLLALLVGLNLSFLIGVLVLFFKITKAALFESVEVFRKDPFLALYFSLSSLLIFRLLCLFPSAVLFTLTIWPFGSSPPPRSPLR